MYFHYYFECPLQREKTHICCVEKTGNLPYVRDSKWIELGYRDSEIKSAWRRRQRRTTSIFYLITYLTLGQALIVLLVAETTRSLPLLHRMTKSTSGLCQTDVANEPSINRYSPLMEADALPACDSVLKIAHWLRAAHIQHWSNCGLRSDWRIKLTTIDEAATAAIDAWFSTDKYV